MYRELPKRHFVLFWTAYVHRQTSKELIYQKDLLRSFYTKKDLCRTSIHRRASKKLLLTECLLKSSYTLKAFSRTFIRKRSSLEVLYTGVLLTRFLKRKTFKRAPIYKIPSKELERGLGRAYTKTGLCKEPLYTGGLLSFYSRRAPKELLALKTFYEVSAHRRASKELISPKGAAIQRRFSVCLLNTNDLLKSFYTKRPSKELLCIEYLLKSSYKQRAFNRAYIYRRPSKGLFVTEGLNKSFPTQNDFFIASVHRTTSVFGLLKSFYTRKTLEELLQTDGFLKSSYTQGTL